MDNLIKNKAIELLFYYAIKKIEKDSIYVGVRDILQMASTSLRLSRTSSALLQLAYTEFFQKRWKPDTKETYYVLRMFGIPTKKISQITGIKKQTYYNMRDWQKVKPSNCLLDDKYREVIESFLIACGSLYKMYEVGHIYTETI